MIRDAKAPLRGLENHIQDFLIPRQNFSQLRELTTGSQTGLETWIPTTNPAQLIGFLRGMLLPQRETSQSAVSTRIHSRGILFAKIKVFTPIFTKNSFKIRGKHR